MMALSSLIQKNTVSLWLVKSLEMDLSILDGPDPAGYQAEEKIKDLKSNIH